MTPILSGVDRDAWLDVCVEEGVTAMLNHHDLIRMPNYAVRVRQRCRDGTAPDLVLDSGAFQGRDDLELYMDTLDAFEGLVDWYANLDAIGNPDRTEERYDRLRYHGYNPVWVAQPGVSIDRVRQHAAHSARIAIGGLVQAQPADQELQIRRVARVCAEAGCRLHVFGTSNPQVLRRIRGLDGVDSVDTARWINGQKYGELLLADGHRVTAEEVGLKFTGDELIRQNARQCIAWITGEGDTRQHGLFAGDTETHIPH